MAAALWWPLSLWLSPAAAWFIFFNAVAVMSSSSSPSSSSSAPRRRLCRSGSSVVLDRLRSSFSIFAVHPVASGVTGTPPLEDDGASGSGGGASSSDDAHCYYCSSLEAGEAAMAHVIAHGEQHERSLNATATSIDAMPRALAPAEEHHAAAHGAPPPENDEVEAEAVAEAEEEGLETEEHDESSMSLDEAYALAQRLRAQEQASPPSPSPPRPATAAVTVTEKKPAKKKVEDGMRRRRRGKAEEAVEGKAELNARAELFIRQFREELKLQRLNSILSHTRALDRLADVGGAVAPAMV
ncbi:hypothetical protein HU200_033248 [Digitaria exilis]|uniref:Uncharacterized protein n=1 Tax=Digitaria exilis TaxID=1010633 RepID=A0A835BS34_9POAL|nr:hypothetical protein HU200_033248 [Digitaria exilis]